MIGRIIITGFSLLFIFSSTRAEIYLWPLHGERRLSSSFSEYREGHYHAGIDIRTFGSVGKPCLAIGAGSVVRIKIAPTGYGKALYLGLDDGPVVVYAHIYGFSRDIDSLLYDHRIGGRSPWCDITFPEGRFMRSVGDTICYSGQSGTIAPHLHFEIRDSGERPFDPLESLYSVPDESPPIISGVTAVPLSVGSLAEGALSPIYRLFRASGERLYVLDDTLQLDGIFGFGVSLWDEQGFGRYRMAPKYVDFSVDGQVLYSIRNNKFSYTQSKEIRFEYDIEGEGAAGRYVLLYRKKGLTRSDREGSGVVSVGEAFPGGCSLEAGIHRGEVLAGDASGNESRAVFHFALHSYPVITTARKLAAAAEVVVASHDPDGGEVESALYESLDDGSSWRRIALEPFGQFWRGMSSGDGNPLFKYVVSDDEGAKIESFFCEPGKGTGGGQAFAGCVPEPAYEGVVLHVTTDRILSSVPAIERVGGDPAGASIVRRTGAREFKAFFGGEHIEDGLNIFRVSGHDHRGFPLRSCSAFRIFLLGSGKRVGFDLSDSLHFELRSPSIIGRAACVVREVTAPEPFPAELKPLSPPYSIEFPRDRINRPLYLSCDSSRGTGLFRFNEKGGWKCIGVPSMEGGSVGIDREGIYALCVDGIPPRIEHVALESRPVGSGFFKPFEACLPVVENGSGVDPYSVKAYLDGVEVVCEWDGYREYLRVPILSSRPVGLVSLKVEVGDLAGNSTVESFSFVIE